MEANTFVANLKADGSANDRCNLDQVFSEYKHVRDKLSVKDRGAFALNVLCVLCRNLDKAPSWTSKVDSSALLTLSIDCIRETRSLGRPDRVKTLACIYHIQKHVVKQNTLTSPELLLKMSYMPFQNADDMLGEYCKTYWNVLVDRLSFIEKLKASKLAIIKLLAKLTEDVQHVISIYDTVQFCMNILVFLVKKLHFLYNDINSGELNVAFGKVFESLRKKDDLKSFKTLTDTESMELYVKLNDCLYVMADNSSKINFKTCLLSSAVCTCLALLGSHADKFHCFQSFYSNAFCSILTKEVNVYTETILNNILLSCESTEKMGYKATMNATYPYLNQFLRLYIEYHVTNSVKIKWNNNFTTEIQEHCLKLTLFLMRKLKHCEQLLKCENCRVKTGLHDSLRLSFLVKHFISISLEQEIDVTKILPLHYLIVKHQYEILTELCSIGCVNYDKCYKKLQTDVHNTAILLNKSKNYEYSIKLFNIYLVNEIKHFRNENDMKNISRALYNKSICELDYMQHENALVNAYLSLLFTQDGLTDKHMSLVMDIKAKLLKHTNDDDVNQDGLQLMSVFEACIYSIENNCYGNLKPFFCNLKFSSLLKHEFSMYVQLWPSVVPVAGVWRSLYDLSKMKRLPWIKVTDDDIVRTLYEVVLETPTAVRTIHSEYFATIVRELVDEFDSKPAKSADMKVIHATLLLLKAEYDLADAGQKYGWKVAEPTMDPDQAEAVRTLPQEFEATRAATRAVEVWTDVIKELKAVAGSGSLCHALQVAQVSVQQLLQLDRHAHALQLAHACCQLARHLGDKAVYMDNACVIIQHAQKPHQVVTSMVALCSSWWGELMASEDTVSAALAFLCESAMYYNRIGSVGVAARLMQVAQAHILDTCEKRPGINLDSAVGKLLEAQAHVCRTGLSAMSAVNAVHRHYITVPNTATRWHGRRLAALRVKRLLSASAARCAGRARGLALWRRARALAAAALGPAGAAGQARLFAHCLNASATGDAQIKIDNRLKHILGLQPSNESQPHCVATELKSEPFTPKQDVETMLDHLTFKKTQTSPSVPCLSVPGFNMPDFLNHDKCQCYACQMPYCLILACQTCSLEAAMYFRANELAIARNYFDGAFKCFGIVERKLKEILKQFGEKYEGYVVDMFGDICESEFRRVRLMFLIEASFFEIAECNFKKADENIVFIHELLQESKNIDMYLKSDVMNLMLAAARLREVKKKPDDITLEAEFEALKLSPVVEPPKTPEAKPEKPPAIIKLVVKDEEIPNTKRRVIKLNLDDNSSDEKQPVKRTSKRTAFKIPVPVTSKPVLENITPRPSRSKPDILLTQPSEDKSSIFDFATPKPVDQTRNEFFTPQETPDQFFTPMTSVKTYSKKSLRQGIVKNLENEFSTPKAKEPIVDKENDPIVEKVVTKPKTKSKVETGSLKSLKDKRTLKRATSPGKLVEEKPVATRSSRLRQPIRFSTDEKK